MIGEAEANLRSLLAIPDSHHVVFCQGGASMQFSMVPMNLLRGDERPAAYVVTGSWGAKALKEAEKEGPTRVVWSGKDEGFVRVPRRRRTARPSSTATAAYLHITSNETIHGVEFPATPAVPPACR